MASVPERRPYQQMVGQDGTYQVEADDQLPRVPVHVLLVCTGMRQLKGAPRLVPRPPIYPLVDAVMGVDVEQHRFLMDVDALPLEPKPEPLLPREDVVLLPRLRRQRLRHLQQSLLARQ